MSSNILHISQHILKSNLPPAIFVSPVSGKTFAVPDWVEFPAGTTVKQIHDIWNRNHTQPAAPVVKEFNAKSSDGKRTYTITFNKTWSCTCDGFMYRNKCSHIDKFKNK